MIQFNPETDGLIVEPARVHVVYFVSSIHIGNTGRTVADPPDGCERDLLLYRVPNEEGTIIEATDPVGLTGKVVFKEGYNVRIYQNAGDTITIDAEPGVGESSITAQNSEIPLYDNEPVPSNSEFLSGGIPCNRTIKAINGLNLSTIPIKAGPGIEVQTSGSTITIAIKDAALKSCSARTPQPAPCE